MKKGSKKTGRAAGLDFAPAVLRIQATPPSPMPRAVLWTLLGLVAATLVWAAVGRLDIIAVAEGRIVPQSYLQIVQPAEQGVLKELLVAEGDRVGRGQVLARMDTSFSEADLRALQNEIALRRLTLRRIEAELTGAALVSRPDDPPALFVQVDGQYRARRQAHLDSLAAERSVRTRAEQELRSAQEVAAKLRRTIPIYREQEEAFAKLTSEGYSGRMLYLEKQRDRIEKEQDLRAQEFAIEGLRATIEESDKRTAQLTSQYRQGLQNERVDVEATYVRLQQDLDKQTRRRDLLELRAPQDGVVKDLATHTAGTVLGPGTVLMTLVPVDEPLQAEVWVTHDDAGFVAVGQPVRLKFATYPFQKYGMLEGTVRRISPDASDAPDAARSAGRRGGSGYRALVALGAAHLEADGKRYPLAPGMVVTAEINLGSRTVLEYVLSPVQRALHEAGRER